MKRTARQNIYMIGDAEEEEDTIIIATSIQHFVSYRNDNI